MRKRVYPVLPSEPLVALVEARGGFSAVGGDNGTFRRRNYVRAKNTGDLTIWQADNLAHQLLGMHPWEVWGEAWFEAGVL